MSTSGNAPQAGDLGWLAKESGYDTAFMDAVFAVAQNATTDIVEGDDGVFRIGRYTEIARRRRWTRPSRPASPTPVS